MATSGRRGVLRVAVASEQSLVAESVRAALDARGLDTVIVRWPGGSSVPRARGSRPASYDVGLLISDLDRTSRLQAAQMLVSRLRTRWVVLTGAERGPLWGAMLDAGAWRVLPSSTSLDRVEGALRQTARGRGAAPRAEVRRLTASWDAFRAEREELQGRVESLTPREREVLALLRQGDTVGDIAAVLEISPATVRSQVKSVLRKLHVNSQLAAVAAIGSLLEPEDLEQAPDSTPEQCAGGAGPMP